MSLFIINFPLSHLYFYVFLEDHCILIDCRSLALEAIPMVDESLRVIVINTNVKHKLEGSEYPTRRKQCETAAKTIAAKYPGSKITHLRDCTMDQLETVKGELDVVSVYTYSMTIKGYVELVERG